jgi:hypothetical protein
LVKKIVKAIKIKWSPATLKTAKNLPISAML